MMRSISVPCPLVAIRCWITSVSDVDWKIEPFGDEPFAQHQRVGEVAVMGDREAARRKIRIQRLYIAQKGFAGRGIADMADRRLAFERIDDLFRGQRIRDETEAAMSIEMLSVETHDSGGFLPPMLQGVQAENRMGRGVVRAENSENSAFLAKFIEFTGSAVVFFRHQFFVTPSTRSSIF